MIDNNLLKRFYRQSIIIFLILGTICTITFIWIVPQFYFNAVPFIFFYFFLLGYFTFKFLIKIHNLPTQQFTKKFMVFSYIKFFGSIIIAFLFLYFFPSHQIPFLVIFIILYFTTLIQGVRNFLRVLNQRNPK